MAILVCHYDCCAIFVFLQNKIILLFTGFFKTKEGDHKVYIFTKYTNVRNSLVFESSSFYTYTHTNKFYTKQTYIQLTPEHDHDQCPYLHKVTLNLIVFLFV